MEKLKDSDMLCILNILNIYVKLPCECDPDILGKCLHCEAVEIINYTSDFLQTQIEFSNNFSDFDSD